MAEFTHLDAAGSVRMVDIGAKEISQRFAAASARIVMNPSTAARIQEGNMIKGNVLATARVAGISAAKRTADLIPLCHPVRLDGIEIEFIFTNATMLRIRAQVRATDRTGVEMEALVAASVAALTIYDMCKSIDRGMWIDQVIVEEKLGGKSGHFVHPPIAKRPQED